MITHTIQRWLNKLFAWWPWQKPAEQAYSQSASTISKGITQDPAGRTTVDGTLPQAGSMSVAVEHELIDTDQSIADERAEPFAQSPPATVLGERSSHSTIPSIDPATVSLLKNKDVPLPTPEQKLAFLQYLVKRGTFNEGFTTEQVPEQYRQNL